MGPLGYFRSVTDERQLIILLTKQGRSLRALAATIPADVLCASSYSADELGALKRQLDMLRGYLAQG